MPKYVIEREIPGAGNMTPLDLQAVSQTSCGVLQKLGPQIQWLHSYVTGDKIYCVYIAPNEDLIREHAQQGGFPANRISEIKSLIDPTTAEAKQQAATRNPDAAKIDGSRAVDAGKRKPPAAIERPKPIITTSERGAPAAAAPPPAHKTEVKPLVKKSAATPAAPTHRDDQSATSAEELRRTKSSPLVRKIAEEHGIDIKALEGTGMSGRVTKNDILSFIESGAPAQAPATSAKPASSQPDSMKLRMSFFVT